MTDNTVESKIYASDYFLERCGGIEFFRKYGYKILKPSMQHAIQKADLKPADRILDIGCGRGELVAYLDDKGFNVTGIDYSEAAIACAKSLYPKGKYQLVRSDQRVFEEASFDKIFLLGTIEHLYEHEIEKTLLEIKRLLKPGGRCVITTCTNALYYKTNTYHLRKAAGDFLSKIGLKMKPPSPPRSDEDEAMHINEKHLFLFDALKKVNLPFTIIPRPNPKLSSVEIYGAQLPADFPLRAKSAALQFFYRVFVFHFPLTLFLARSHAATISAPE